MNQSTWVIDRYLGLSGKDLTKIYYHRLPDTVIKHGLTQSWLIASEAGKKLIEVHQIIDRTNLQLTAQNSPEFVLTSPKDWGKRKVNSMLHNQKKMSELKSLISDLLSMLKLNRKKIESNI